MIYVLINCWAGWHGGLGPKLIYNGYSYKPSGRNKQSNKFLVFLMSCLQELAQELVLELALACVVCLIPALDCTAKSQSFQRHVQYSSV
jgi:hypothetical protein